MTFNWRSSPALWLAAASLALLFLPGRISDSIRLTVLAGLGPIRGTAQSAHRALDRASSQLAGAPEEELRRKLDYLEAEVLRLQELLTQYRARIAALAQTRQVIREPETEILTADIILPAGVSMWRRAIVVSRGSNHGVTPGLPVLWNQSLIGQVAEVAPYTSRISLITDPSFTIGAATLPQMDAEGIPLTTRDVGILQGTTEGCRLKWLTGDRTIEPGTHVVTTADPLHGIPKGLILGQGVEVSRARGPYAQVRVEPLINVHALEFVTILKPKDP